MGLLGFLKPSWFKALPEPLKNIDEERMKAIRLYQQKHRIPDEKIFQGILCTRWAIKNIQHYVYGNIKKLNPQYNEKQVWQALLENRIRTILEVQTDTFGPHCKQLSNSELNMILNSSENIVNGYESLSQLVEYIIEIDEKENSFYDPFGIISELDYIFENGMGSFYY